MPTATLGMQMCITLLTMAATPTLTEKKNGVAPWMDIRLKADGIDWRNIGKPLYVMGSAYADGKVPHAFADELLPTLRTKSGDVIVMPDGKVYRAMGRVL